VTPNARMAPIAITNRLPANLMLRIYPSSTKSLRVEGDGWPPAVALAVRVHRDDDARVLDGDRYEDEAQKAEGARLFAEVKALMPSHIYLEWRPYRLRLPGHARSERPTE
jgi:hypothetical protein